MQQETQDRNNLTPAPSAGPGSFWISAAVVEALICQANAVQICAYLILAKSTDKNGTASSAGATAVGTALGVSRKAAGRILASLSTIAIKARKGRHITTHRLVYTASEWTSLTGEAFDRTTVKSQVRYVLVQSLPGEEIGHRVWFANTLVDGYGSFKHPLKKVKALGDVAARLLLTLYQCSDMQDYGGADPNDFCRNYLTYQVSSSGQYDLWHGVPDKDPSIAVKATLPIFNLHDIPRKKKERDLIWEQLKDALLGLSSSGLIYEVVTVFDRPFDVERDATDMGVLYELDTRSIHGYKPKGEEGLGGDTAHLAGFWGCPVTDKHGRFTGTYAAVTHTGTNPSIIGIYRLRFRVTNAKNASVTESFRRIGEGQREWKKILDTLLRLYTPRVSHDCDESGGTT